MSRKQGRRRTSGKGRSAGAAASRPTAGRPAGPVATRRLGLLVFGAALVVLFAVVAIAVGVGHPSVPSGDVALVEDTPGDVGKVTEARFEHALELGAAQAGAKEAPKPGDPQYEELKESAMQSTLEAIWIQGLAAEWGIEASDKEIAAELKKVKKTSFKSDAEFQKFLKESHYTSADVNERVELQILSGKLQQQLKEGAPTPSQGEVESYYEAAKSSQFTQKPTREVRIVRNKDRKKAQQALEALSKDDSAKNWEKVATKYSEDPTTKENGGLQSAVQEGVLEEPLDADVFGADEGKVIGPVKTKQGFTVFEVESSTPESVQELKLVESQIKSTLAQRLEQEYFASFVGNFNTEWTQRTFCADGYVVERCSNFEGSGHPKTAPPGCYEAHPKGGLPEACPAPVFQLAPAAPGSVTPLEPKGKPLPQRPQPGGLKEAEEPPPGTLPITP